MLALTISLCLVSPLAIASAGAAPSMRARLAAHAAAARSRRAGSRHVSGAERVRLANALGVGPGAVAAAGFAPRLLAGGATIEGTVTSATSKAPLAEVEVCAYERAPPAEPEELPFFECAITGPSGDYAIEVPPGGYDVEFYVSPESGLNYQTQFYKDRSRYAEADPVDPGIGLPATGIDAALLPGGEITGTVTSAATGAPVSNVLVCALDDEIESGNCVIDEASGSYAVLGLGTGTRYVVGFFPSFPEGEFTYVTQFYDGKTREVEATPVSVEAGGPPRENVDAALLESVPLARSQPSIAGSAVAGQTLTLAHASWSNQPTSFIDHWLRCATSESAICLVVGTGGSYALQSSDVGSVIRVKEWAFGAAGESEPVGSAPTAIVQAAPTAGATQAPAAPAPTAALGNLASKSVVASVAQLRSLLDRLLAPSGRNAKIGRLLEHRGYTASFDALGAGKLTISWYVVPKGAHLAGAKPVLVASGSVTTSAAGPSRVTIRLSAKGRGLLAHAHRVQLTAKGSLAASGHAALAATHPFTLTR